MTWTEKPKVLRRTLTLEVKVGPAEGPHCAIALLVTGANFADGIHVAT
jgi:hypothetical protein